MIVTTTPSVEGKTIAKYLGLVCGQAEHMNEASTQMKEMATNNGVDAIVGVQLIVTEAADSYRHTTILCGTAVKFN